MSLRNTNDRWAWPSMTLHWLIALLILALLGVGFVMVELPRSPRYFWVYDLHKSIGLTVLALFVLRLAWRFFDRRPADLPMPRLQRIAAHAVHGILYLLMLAIPLAGWLYNSARGYPLQWFKQFNLPALVAKNEGLAEFAIAAHVWLFWILVAVLVAHVGGALLHHFFERDDTLRRMLPFARLRHPPSGESP